MKIHLIKLEEKATIIGIGWTCVEDMLIIKENGEIQVRNMFGTLKSVMNTLRDAKAIDFRIFHTFNTYSSLYTTGIVILSSKRKFIILKDIYDQKLQQFPEIPGSLDVESWCVISTDRKCFILASKGTDIYQLNLGGSPQILVAVNSIN
jgi:hypothetical protein